MLPTPRFVSAYPGGLPGVRMYESDAGPEDCVVANLASPCHHGASFSVDDAQLSAQVLAYLQKVIPTCVVVVEACVPTLLRSVSGKV